jgi:hypothetical protein
MSERRYWQVESEDARIYGIYPGETAADAIDAMLQEARCTDPPSPCWIAHPSTEEAYQAQEARTRDWKRIDEARSNPVQAPRYATKPQIDVNRRPLDWDDANE